MKEKEGKKIYIRADMNETIATGHIMRCLSIADAARQEKVETVFVTADETPLELLKNRGYEAIVLHTLWNCMEEELEVLLPLIREHHIHKLLVDSYQVTEAYLKRLEEVTEVYYLDDLDAFVYPVSNVICYANYASQLSYGNAGGNTRDNTRFYLGTGYMPLRKAYQNAKPKEIKENIESVLLLSGGSDPFHMMEQMAALLLENSKIQVDIICGAFYPDFQGLKDRFFEYSHLHFYQNVGNLEEFMEKADVAVSAGGTTLYELCAKGTPTISYSFAENQLRNVKQFDEDQLISYAGDVRFDPVYEKMAQLLELYQDSAFRKERSVKMQQMVDGQGGARIVKLLLDETKEEDNYEP